MMTPESRSGPAVPVWFTTVVTVPILVGMLWFGRGLLMPLAVSILLFILSSAMVDRARSFRIGRWHPPNWLAHVVSVAVVVSAVLLFAGILANAADDVREALPRYQERLAELAAEVTARLGSGIVATLWEAASAIDLQALTGSAFGHIGGLLSSLILVGIFLLFLLVEKTKWAQKIPRLAENAEEAAKLERVMERIAKGVKEYMWVNALTSTMSATVAFVIFSLIDLDFAPLLALIVFVAGFIPNVGAFIGIVLPATIALIQFDSVVPFLVVLVGYGLVDQFIGNVIQPTLQGRTLNVSTFMVMVLLSFWATVWGGVGAFLAIPMMYVTMVVCAEFPATRWIAVLLSADGELDA